MSRGGKRERAGRKSTWNAGKTKAVKIPELIATEVLELAKMIDCGNFDRTAIANIFARAAEKMTASRRK